MNIYFRNDAMHAVAVTNAERLAEQLEKIGFVRCTNAEYFEARLSTWNDSAIIDMEGKPNVKKSKKSKAHAG